MTKPKIGLLPLYLELYDRAMPEVRGRMEEFLANVVNELKTRGLDVVEVPICRIRPEFEAAVKSIEDAGADGIVTLHLAYSPSLESSEVLAGTKLPIMVLDTTPTFSYSPEQDPEELMYNHGIHGVQDMCNLLIQNGKTFDIAAGHWKKSDALDRVARWAKSARVAMSMRTARVGRIGESFAGMGDFAVESDVLRETIGVETVPCDLALLRSLMPSDAEVEAECSRDNTRFNTLNLPGEVHRRSVRAGLAVRKWIEQEKLTAFSMNFLAFDQASGVSTVPFLEASKAMARGVGYAGEGDVLTAALTGALASVYPETTFTEMFCPDWEGNSIFLSHMGEMNVDLAADVPEVMEKPFPWTDADNPAVAVGRFKGGKAVFVNLAPGPDKTYTLVVAPVNMLDVSGQDRMNDSIHGWFEPEMPVADFLEAYSRVGGTHHAVLVYGDVVSEIAAFGTIMGWDVAILG